MVYKIIITRKEATENYSQLMEEWNEKNRFGAYNKDFNSRPEVETIKNVLMCELTEEEFNAVKKEVLTTFK